MHSSLKNNIDMPDETLEALNDLETMPHEDLCGYFECLAEDHIDSGKFATAADYMEAADRIRDLRKAYELARSSEAVRH